MNKAALLVSLLTLCACGQVTTQSDAAVAVDAPPSIDAASADAAIDAGTPDAAPTDAAPTDAASCVWISLDTCDTGGTIAEFCPSGTSVGRLRRCDMSIFEPDPSYLTYHLCRCDFESCGCSGVAWNAVECCN